MQLRKIFSHLLCFSALVAVNTAIELDTARADTRYVSKLGADSPTCGSTNAAACLTITTALANAVTAGGYVRVILTSNGAFQEAITITTPTELRTSGDVVALIAPPAGQVAITVNAGVNDYIRMSDMYLGGNSGAAAEGIRFNSGASLEIHNTQIRGFGGPGLNFKPSGGTMAHLLIDRSEIADGTTQCVMVVPSGMQANAVVTNSLIHNCGTLGLRADSQSLTAGSFVKTFLANTRIFSVGASAVSAFSGAGGGNARVSVDDGQLVNAATGAVANGPAASVVLNRTTVSGTSTALNGTGGGLIYSYGNNAINFNASPGSAPTPVAPQ